MGFSKCFLSCLLAMWMFGAEAWAPQFKVQTVNRDRCDLAMIRPSSTNLLNVSPRTLPWWTTQPICCKRSMRDRLGLNGCLKLFPSRKENVGQTVGDKVHPRRALRKRWVVFLLLALSALFVPTRSASALQEGAAMLLQEAGTAGSGLVTNPPVTTTMLHVVASPMSRSAELRLAGRLVYASLLGATVGKERSGKQHHPAGVRTMALVSLGAATFTLCSMYGFGGRHDPSRMASNVASGVGFIGAGVITTTAGKEESEDGGSSIVHGLTTAAAIWLSAAVGVGCGVGMCVLSTTAAILTITILRIGRVAQNLQETKRKFALQQQAAVSLLTTRRVYPDPLLLRALRRDMRRSSKSKRSEKYQEKEGTDESETIQKSNVNIHQNDLDFYEEKEDQFVFHGQRPENGWNETDKMDA